MNKGFTLIELMVVMVIIGILAAIGLPIYLNQIMKAENTEVLMLLDSLATPIEEFNLINNRYPADVNSGNNPGLSVWPTEIPFDSVLDYEHWSVEHNMCVVLINHFGRNRVRDAPVHMKAGEVGSIVMVDDDFIKTIAEYPCDSPRGSIR